MGWGCVIRVVTARGVIRAVTAREVRTMYGGLLIREYNS